MSGICGWVGEGAPEAVERMLAAIDYRGDSQDTVSLPGVALGYRFWKERPNKAPSIHRTQTAAVACAGTFAPSSGNPAAFIAERVRGSGGLADGVRLDDVDGAFAFA